MSNQSVPMNSATLALGVGVVALLYVLMKGGVRNAAASAAEAAAGAVVDVGVGVVDGTGQAVGLPPLADITTDPAVARWIIDAPNGGYWEASFWSSATALARGWAMAEGTGKPPPRGSRIEELFPTSVNVSGVSGGW